MLRKSPPSTSPPDHDGANDPDIVVNLNDKNDITQGRMIMTPNGVRMDASERTPLIQKEPTFETHHPDWITGQHDLEDPYLERKFSWPRLRNIIWWPQERGLDIVLTVVNPKRWNAKAIWQNAVLAPIHNVPAVILGSELTVLDALSYGMLFLNFPNVISSGNEYTTSYSNHVQHARLIFHFNGSANTTR
jgi:SulP family sulfate permease